jgi:hypothetical protein
MLLFQGMLNFLTSKCTKVLCADKPQSASGGAAGDATVNHTAAFSMAIGPSEDFCTAELRHTKCQKLQTSVYTLTCMLYFKRCVST